MAKKIFDSISNIEEISVVSKRVIADVCDEEGDFYIAIGAEDFYLNYEAAEQALKEREQG